MTYNASSVSDAVIAFRKPITLQQGRGLRDNPLAIAEGLADAPRVQGVALGNVHLFSGQLSTTPVAFTGLDQVLELMVVGSAQHDGTNGGSLQIGFSSDGGSSWGTSQTILAASNVTDWRTANITINVSTGAGYLIGSSSTSGTVGPAIASLSLTVPSGVNAVRLSRGAGANTVYASLFVIGGHA